MYTKEILKYIQLFREKSHNDKLIVFVGAGVSCNVEGMPSWNDLIVKMAEAIKYTKCSTCRKKEKDCKKTCKFSETFSGDEYLKIPQYVFNKSKKLYDKVLRENIQHDPDVDAPLSNAILDLTPSHIITTNYDKLIENCQNVQCDNYEVVIRDKDLLEAQKKKYIIKMHGDISAPETIVLKESDYLDYSQNHVLIEMFVKALLSDHTILFLGYSLNDYNIKLIISWINYIRTQNKALDSEKKFAYIVLDEKKITKNQNKYFESNNIGVVNLNKMPLIDNIPNSLKNEIGKRLYSFLKITADASLERCLGKLMNFDEAVEFMKDYKFVNRKNICSLLYLGAGTSDLSGNEMILFSDLHYDNLVNYLDSATANASYLKQLLYDNGVYAIRLMSLSSSSVSRRSEIYNIAGYQNSLLDSEIFKTYLSNNYVKLLEIIKKSSDTFEECFYNSIVQGYIQEIYDKYQNICYKKLTTDNRVRFLFNSASLESQKSYKQFNGSKVEKYIAGISNKNQKEIFQTYQDIMDGNYHKLLILKESVSKLKDQYYSGNYSFIACSSLQELIKIKKIAMEQYLFYFKNNIFFRNFSDLKKILKEYIAGIICANGQFLETTGEILGRASKKERYEIDLFDVDIIVKFISIKDLKTLIQEFNLEQFRAEPEIVDYVVESFDNIAKSIINLNQLNRFYALPKNLINCALLLLCLPLNNEHKRKIGGTINYLMCTSQFVSFFFSTDFPEFSISLQIFYNLFKIIPIQQNVEIVKKIVLNPEFKGYYVNNNKYRVRSVLSMFIKNSDLSEIQCEIHNLIQSFEEKEQIEMIRLFYKHITDPILSEQYKSFILEHFDDLDCDDIFEFVSNGWLNISHEHSQKILESALTIYRNQKNSPMHMYPDPLESKLELVYILYITGKINDISALKEMEDEKDFIKFFLDSDNFDYKKVDFSNYMWENIVRREKFMTQFVAHKDDIIPNIQRKVNLDKATELERKMLYGYLLDKDDLLRRD